MKSSMSPPAGHLLSFSGVLGFELTQIFTPELSQRSEGHFVFDLTKFRPHMMVSKYLIFDGLLEWRIQAGVPLASKWQRIRPQNGEGLVSVHLHDVAVFAVVVREHDDVVSSEVILDTLRLLLPQ